MSADPFKDTAASTEANRHNEVSEKDLEREIEVLENLDQPAVPVPFVMMSW